MVRVKRTQMVSIYSLGSRLYVISMVQLPNVAWKLTGAAHEVTTGDVEGLASAIEAARQTSHAFSGPRNQPVAHSPVDPALEALYDKAEKIWVIRWYEDGHSDIIPQEPITPVTDDPELGESGGWQGVKNEMRELPAPVNALDIARQLLTPV